MTAASVIVCTHNPRADYLSRAIDGLRAQTMPTADWELILVDNASAPGKAPAGDLSWHPRARIVREDALGLTPARLRGIREASADLLVFVDDDNVLDPDFLATAHRIALERPFLGSWSGQCRPEFDQPPPDWTRPYWGNLVIREFDRDVWSNLPRLPASMPCGAGLCVRRAVAERYLHLHVSGQRALQLDRTGSSLLSGGDNDLAACACDLGLGLGLVSDLRLTHLIPPERLTADYLARLAEGIFYSAVLIAYLRSSVDELRSYRVRWIERLRVLLKRQPHRRIHAAGLRGRDRGLRFLSSLNTAAPKHERA
jgi:glycosyltransferase involved in cell wall biosynthesis